MSLDFASLCIIGAGGHAKVVFDALRAAGYDGPVTIRDDAPRPGHRLFDQEILTPAIPQTIPPGQAFHVAIGANAARQRIAGDIVRLGGTLATIVHPGAHVAASASLGQGTLVAAGAVIGPSARLGDAVIVNHNAVVDHDCAVGAATHIAPGAILGGCVAIGAGVLIGAAATILPGQSVGDGAVVAAGAVVVRAVANGACVAGVPAALLPAKS
jgi:sugar O-acyltransferase (sialic acid O-acetyltransferase NeuD family)